MGKTAIAWTDETWNPVTGCTKVSPGCDHCYAERLTQRWGGDFSQVILHPKRLEAPLHWQKPRMIFVCSMADLFHPRVPFGFIQRVFAVATMAPQHVFQLLTKRPGRMAYFASEYRAHGWPPNVWAGTSVESTKYLPRLNLLAKVPAKMQFLSAEPLLSALDLRPWLANGTLSQVIIGGESGPGHRSMDIAWLQDIVSQCKEAGVAAFVKQASGQRPGMQGRIPDDLWALKEYPNTGGQ